jgi:putative peptidoglycan lipid II flippase
MRFREQTALEGVLTAGTLNLGSRFLMFLRHVVITAYIGLSTGLDAFYIAMSILGIFIIVMADVFDSLGIPYLVRAWTEEGEPGFQKVSASIFSLSVWMSIVLSALMLIFSPLAPSIAAGFTEAARGTVFRYLFLLFPMAACYLPYHALGSFFRARRRFQAFYLAELLVSAAGLLIIAASPRNPDVIPAAWSVSYIIGFLFLFLLAGNTFGKRGKTDRTVSRDFLRTGLRLLPVYGVTYLYIIADRYFASFLPTGSVSALSYGLMLAVLLPGILNMENIFITPLSETENRGEILEWILKGLILLCIPVMTFTLYFALPIVQAVFERGSFTSVSSGMTATALTYYVAALPCILLTAILSRVLMIEKRIERLVFISIAGVSLNVLLNYLFVFRVGLGIKGIALATALTNTAVAASLLVLSCKSSRIGGNRYVTGVLVPSLAAASLGLGSALLLPETGFGILTISARGIAFVAVYAGVLKILPIGELRRIEGMVWSAFFRKPRGTSPNA